MPAVTSVTNFSDGNVLTATALNAVNCGIHVYADSAARDAAYGGSGERTLVEGEYAYLLDTNQTLVYSGSSWVSVATAPGLVLVKSQVIGSAVSSVTVSDAFSSTYDNYKITINGGVGSTNANITLQLGATTTGYYYSYLRTASYISANYDGQIASNTTSFQEIGYMSANVLHLSAEIINPNLAKPTFANAAYIRSDNTSPGAGTFTGFLAGTTQYTAFTLAPLSGTFTGGTIRVYGYSTS